LTIDDQHTYSVGDITQLLVTSLGIIFLLSAVLIRLGAYKIGSFTLFGVQSFIITSKTLIPLITDKSLSNADKNYLLN
jgi:hypothetical protein